MKIAKNAEGKTETEAQSFDLTWELVGKNFRHDKDILMTTTSC